MSTNRPFIFMLSLLCIGSAFAQSASLSEKSVDLQNAVIEHTQLQTLQAERFSIDLEDWQRYETIMEGVGRYHWKDVDPVWVLAIYARSEQERTRLAELAARQEFDRTRRLLLFKDAYVSAFQRMYGHIPIMDEGKLRQRTGDFQLEASVDAPPPISGNNIDALFNDVMESSGDRYALFLTADCAPCEALFERISMAMKPGIAIDVYFIGESNDAVIEWARKKGVRPEDIEAGHITLNTDQKMYDLYGRPALPAAFYYRAKDQKVMSVRLEDQ